MKFKIHAPMRGVIGLALAVLLSGGAAAQSKTATVATLGTVGISPTEIERLLQSMPEAERAKVRDNRTGLEAWLRQRLAGEALLQEAQQQRWAERPEVRARIEAATQEITARIVSNSYLESVTQLPSDFPRDAELKAAYDSAKTQLQIPATYRVAQIFLPSVPGAEASIVRAEAAKLAEQARHGDFAVLAKSRSQDAPSAAQGGEVGSLPLAQMLPETRDTVAALKPGQVSDPVQSASGFHVLKLLASQPARTATLEEARPQLQALLREQRRQELAQEYLNKLAPASDVRIDRTALDAVLKNIR